MNSLRQTKPAPESSDENREDYKTDDEERGRWVVGGGVGCLCGFLEGLGWMGEVAEVEVGRGGRADVEKIEKMTRWRRNSHGLRCQQFRAREATNSRNSINRPALLPRSCFVGDPPSRVPRVAL